MVFAVVVDVVFIATQSPILRPESGPINALFVDAVPNALMLLVVAFVVVVVVVVAGLVIVDVIL